MMRTTSCAPGTAAPSRCCRTPKPTATLWPGLRMPTRPRPLILRAKVRASCGGYTFVESSVINAGRVGGINSDQLVRKLQEDPQLASLLITDGTDARTRHRWLALCNLLPNTSAFRAPPRSCAMPFGAFLEVEPAKPSRAQSDGSHHSCRSETSAPARGGETLDPVKARRGTTALSQQVIDLVTRRGQLSPEATFARGEEFFDAGDVMPPPPPDGDASPPPATIPRRLPPDERCRRARLRGWWALPLAGYRIRRSDPATNCSSRP